MGKLIVLVLSAAAVASCATPRRYIDYDAQLNSITSKPRYAATGDSLLLVIHDTLYRNLYSPKSDTSPVVVGERAAIFGAADIGKLAEAFPAQIFGPHVDVEPNAGTLSALTSTVLPPGGRTTYDAFISVTPADKDKNERLGKLLEGRNAAIQAECRRPVAAASVYFLAHPDDFSFLEFLADPKAHDQARRLATADDAAWVADLAETLDKRSLTVLELDSLEVRGIRFAQRVDALALRLPADLKTFRPNPTQLDTLLETVHGCVDVRLMKSDKLAKTQRQIEQLIKNGATLPPGYTIRPDPLRIGGVEINPFVERSNTEALAELYSDLTRIARTTSLVVAALNAAPTYTSRYCKLTMPGDNPALVNICGDTTRVATADTVYVGTYWKPIQVRVTPVRGSRFAKFIAPPVVTFAAVGTPAPPSADSPAKKPGKAGPATPGETRSSKKSEVNSSSDGSSKSERGKAPASTDSASSDSAKSSKAGKKDSSAAPEPEPASLPSAAVDVLERYRFHVGFGYASSQLRTHTYSATPDTVGGVVGTRVAITGDARSQQFPIATLSYVLLPWRGKVFAAQAYDPPTFRRYLSEAGVSAQFGLSLQHPTEQLFAGLSTELLPGLEVGVGKHFGYGDHSKYGNNAFVSNAADPTPVRKQWAHSSKFIDAVDVTVDGSAILAAFGKLLSLK